MAEEYMDEGYNIRAFDSEIVASDLPDYSSGELPKKEDGRFVEFLNLLNSAPSLNGLSEKSDADVHSLLINDYFVRAITDLVNIAALVNNTPEKILARRTLEGLVDKGYPEAQLLYGQILANEGNSNKAHDLFLKVESNPYATDEQSDQASSYKSENPRSTPKPLMQCLAEQSEKALEQPLSENSDVKANMFMDMANSAKNLDDVSDENLSTEMSTVNSQIVGKFYDKPFSEYKTEDVKSLEILSQKRHPLAQSYLLSYYANSGQHSKAYSVAGQLKLNPYASDNDAKHAEKMAMALLPIIKKQQALKTSER